MAGGKFLKSLSRGVRGIREAGPLIRAERARIEQQLLPPWSGRHRPTDDPIARPGHREGHQPLLVGHVIAEHLDAVTAFSQRRREVLHPERGAAAGREGASCNHRDAQVHDRRPSTEPRA